MEFLLALLLSFAPAFLCATFIYWIDRYEKEPKLLLGVVFFWGAVVATAGAMVSQLVLEGTFKAATGSEAAADLAGTTLFAPLTEETLKGFAVLLVFLAFRKEFDSVLDGLVYASVVALGFAATEDTLYLLGESTKSGVEGMIGLWVVRVVLGIWDHPFYTAWMGLGLAASRLSRSALVRWLAPPAGWVIAMIAHALHNGLATAAASTSELGLVMLLLDWMGWLLMAVILLVALWRERKMLQAQLAGEVTLGTLGELQYRKALSPSISASACAPSSPDACSPPAASTAWPASSLTKSSSLPVWAMKVARPSSSSSCAKRSAAWRPWPWPDRSENIDQTAIAIF
jgi:RsiW-degrading membrane proteinase PrsW (M82 family)